MKRKYILKNRRRFAGFIMIFSLVTVLTGLMVNAGATSQVQETHAVIQVTQGDTLWEIASTYAQNSDPRAYIYQIKKLNKMSGDDIFMGQVILLP